jgi:D-threo-aldose 1-dehydrogenase
MTDATTRPLGRGGLTVGPNSYGIAALGNLSRAVDDGEAADSMDAAWQAGVRYFDTAPHYGLGLSEERLGRALASRPRDEFLVSTKVGRLIVESTEYPGQKDDEGFDVDRDRVRVRDYTRDGVLRSIEESLERTGLDRFDVVFVHDPDEYYREAMEGAFPALDELRAAGVITSYGAGMNQSAMLADFLLNTDLDVVMVAGCYTLLDDSASADLLPAALDRGVSVVAAAVFNSGLLATDRPRADAQYQYSAAPTELIDRVNLIADVCEEHRVTVPAVAAQFALRHTAVATVCLGARSRAQVERNASLFDVEIPEGLWSDLAERGLFPERTAHHGHQGTEQR